MSDTEPDRIVFSEDGKTVTMSVEKFKLISILAGKNWQAEMNVIHAFMLLNENLFHEDDVRLARDEFDHGVRPFIHDMQTLMMNKEGF